MRPDKDVKGEGGGKTRQRQGGDRKSQYNTRQYEAMRREWWWCMGKGEGCEGRRGALMRATTKKS
jgi:hypothetical protein